MSRLLLAALTASSVLAQSWHQQTSTTTASLRGVSAVNKNIAWASGTKGTILRTTNGGNTWHQTAMANATDLDFRDIEAFSQQTAYVMSAGPGQLSRVYKTTDGGGDWVLQSTENHPKGFWDCMSFWNSKHGMIVGDPIDGRFTVLTTEDGTEWKKREGPAANKDEAMFAASGTCLITGGARQAWFATGGPGGARVYHSGDGGTTWTITQTAIRHDAQSSGIFSMVLTGQTGVVVGGNYSKPTEAADTLALSNDGGKSWANATGLSGFRSAVAYTRKRRLWIATGTSGTDVWAGDGKSWKNIGQGFNALSFAADGTGWGVGANGAIGLLHYK